MITETGEFLTFGNQLTETGEYVNFRLTESGRFAFVLPAAILSTSISREYIVSMSVGEANMQHMETSAKAGMRMGISDKDPMGRESSGKGRRQK